jgi:hypothetical protein
MHRILFCLPLCLCLASDRALAPAESAISAGSPDSAGPAKSGDAPAERPAAERPLFPGVLLARADDGAKLPTSAEMEQLAQKDPIAFLENCLRRCSRELKTYTMIMQKQENLGGKINPTEIIEVRFQDRPHSVYFNWIEGARLAERALYVEGENNGKMLARPKGAVARLVAGDVVAKDVDSDEAKQSGRYTLNNFGLKKSVERTLTAWKASQKEGTLKVEYVGIQKVKEAGDKNCYVLRRTNKVAAADGIKQTTIYIDTENWLQVGIVLKDDNGLLLGSYYFRDIKLNPDFKKEQFSPAALKP